MKVRTFCPRPSAIRGARSFRPEIVDLEERSLMSGDVGLAISQVEKPLTSLESNVFLTEATAMLVDSPLPDRLRARLSQQLQSGTLSREEALRQILHTPQFQAEFIEDLTKRLLDRDPTASESLRLVRGVRSSAMDARWVMRQIMTRAEYLQSTDGSLAGFYKAATQDLLGRDATSEELAALAERPGGTGAVARSRILRDLMGSEEFALAQARSVAARYISGSVTDEELDRFRQSYSGPGGHLAMLTQVLADASNNATGLVPTLEKNPLLSVKRVPGFLSGSITIPGSKNELPQNMAAPYDLFNSGIRKIDNVSVDYWMITLNKGDSIYLKAVHPENQTTDTDIALRIWGPDGKEIGKGLTGGEFSYVAGVAGTYILGISTKDNLNYRFEPTDAPTPSGATVHEFQAQFHVFPGPDTDTISIISNYRNTEYTDNGWRPWTQNEAAAYETLRKIASAGGDPRLTNFTDFRQVGDIDLPSVFDGWLTATWEPFDYMLGHRNDPNVVQDTFAKYHVIQAAFGTISSFDPVAQDFLHKQSVQDAYDSVHQLLADANEMRKNVESNFIAKFLSWATSNEVAFGDEPTDILSLMKNGLTEVQQKPEEVNQLPWIERLIGSIFQIAATAIGAISNAFLPGSGPVATLVASVAGNLISQCIDAWLEGRFDKPKPTPPPPSSPDITGAAIYLKDKSLDAYKNTFDLLTNTKFLTTKVFSNFGLLEALKTIQFTPSMDGDTVPADVLRKAYARASWEELLPRMFSWRRIDFNDPSSSVPKFTNFIPIQETARWEKPNAWWPDGTGGIGWNYYGPLTYPARDMASVWADARSQLTSLQGGTPFDFQGYDFTRSNGDKFDWFGPGNISPAIKLTGHTGHFYAVATDAVLTQPNLWRWNDQFGSWWWTTAKTTGVSIQEWSLQTPDGKGGYMELSQNAADSLFGRTPAGGLVPTGAGLQSYAGGSYLDFAIPSDGVVSRFEVFDSWGKDVKDFSPKTFRPEKSVSGKNVYFTPNPRNFWTNHSPNRGAVPMWDADSQYSDFDLSFGVKSGALLSRTLNPRPVGPIPVPRPPARLAYSL